MKRLALVWGIALAVAVGFFGGRLWAKEEGNGWVVWKKTELYLHDRPYEADSWEIQSSTTNLAECKKLAKGFARIAVEFAREDEEDLTRKHPGKNPPPMVVEYREGSSLYSVSGDDGFAMTVSFDCYPAATDPRPRR
ncbi:MAG: hypothetical protein F9K13_06195 [Candidatus Methylomirabilis oxygeniifera]|uniref:Uncharacterized protein n=1 Tax=Methylomirabilis oxygeniifera TaxID=671143 RepID=D5MHY7_METO1|nr:MAG: hypothetical protein F9K13_06195 [Candidatus Methylomirabilis oxyfera]CBE69278.1 exported protein of unknown function [Candidatus Methylomirabilis oxyfera]